MAAFTRFALVALTGMTGRLMRRKRSSEPARPRGKIRPAGLAKPLAVQQGTATPQATGAPAPVDHFRQLRPRTEAPLLARVAAKSLPALGILGMAATVALAIGSVRGELPYIGEISDATLVLAVALLTISIWAIYLLWKVPQWQAASWARSSNASPREIFQIENDSRSTLGQILSGVAVLTGLIFAWQQLGQTSDNLRVSQEGQITDRFSRAVDQLGSDDLTIRLGGIYSLERIARDSPRDYGPVMEVLTAFVRESSPVTSNAAATPVPLAARPGPDVRAALKVIGRRSEEQVAVELEEGLGCHDLTGVSAVGISLPGANLQNTCWNRSDLRAAQMPGADLTNASFAQANLSQQAILQGVNAVGSTFNDANLANSNLIGSNLEGANLQAANLTNAIMPEIVLANANLLGANLRGAQLPGANLSQSNLSGTQFAGAILWGANLTGARFLTAEQLQGAAVDANTRLPEGVTMATPEP